MTIQLKFKLLFSFFLFTPSLSWGEDAIEIGVTGSYFNYEETGLAGQTLNTEKGGIYGGRLSYRVENEEKAFSVEWRLDANSVDYTGLTNSGSLVKSRTDELISNVLLKYERLFTGLSSIYAGAGYRYWRRDIQSAVLPGGTLASGLLEKYKWPYLAAGITKTFKADESSGKSLDLSVKYAISPNLDVRFNGGVFDNVNVEQGTTLGFSLSYSIWALSKADNKKWSLTPYIDYWHSDRGSTTALTSNGVVAGSVLEPESRTILSGVRASLSF